MDNFGLSTYPKTVNRTSGQARDLKRKVIPGLVHKVEKEKDEFDKGLKTVEKCAIMKL